MQYVYIFTNPAMPEWVKVGKTNDIKKRADQLSKSTSVPLPFECYAFLRVPDKLVYTVESNLHNLLNITNEKRKEYFKMKPEQVYRVFETIAPMNPDFTLFNVFELGEDNVPDLSGHPKKRTFKMLNIPVGTTLYYTQNSLITCTTADENTKVLYDGKTYAISTLAREKLGYKQISGFRIFSLKPNGTSLFNM